MPPPPAPPASRWELDLVLGDGPPAHLRPARPADAEAWRALAGAPGGTSAADGDASVPFPAAGGGAAAPAGLVVERDGQLVAGAGWAPPPAAGGAAEVVVVRDAAAAPPPLPALLVQYLAALGREHGVVRFAARLAPDDEALVESFRDSGYLTVDQDDDVVRVELALEPGAAEGSRSAAEQREHRAEARSIARLLRPASVAVVGASSRHGTPGHQVFLNLLAGEFDGPVHPVNLHASHVASVPAHPSILDVPGEVDLAVVVVPAEQVVATVEQCAEKGVKGVVVVSGGFAEPGDDPDLEQGVRTAAARAGIRVVGPCSVGIANVVLGLDATVGRRRPPAGRTGIAVQSGAIGLALLDRAAATGLGVSTFASLGDKADVSGNDLLEFWEDDPDTDLVLLHLDSFGNPERFAAVARRASRTTPIVAVTPTAVADAPWLGELGVVAVGTIDEMFDVALLLHGRPLPAGDRLAVVTDAVGPSPVSAVGCAAAGLDLVGGPAAGSGLRPGAGPERWAEAVAAAAGRADAVLVVVTGTDDGDGVLDALAASLGELEVPAAVVVLTGPTPVPAPGPSGGVVATYPAPDRAVRALGRVAGLARWRRAEVGAG